MTIEQLVKKRPEYKNIKLELIPLLHPTKKNKKIYIASTWFSGFWYKTDPTNTRVYPETFYGDFLKLEVHPDYLKAIGVRTRPKKKVKKRV